MHLLLWAALLAGATYPALCFRPCSAGRSLWKTLPVALLALAVWQGGGPMGLVMGLGLSALGDFALSRPGQRAFLTGMAAFALAHIVYIALFFTLLRNGHAAPDVLHAILTGGLLGVMLSCKRWLLPFTGPLKGPVIAYVLVLGAMGTAAIWLPDGYWRIRLGAALFVLSDFILSLETFRLPGQHDPHRIASVLVWISYFSAQCLLTWGLFLAL